ncbi:DUF6042 family protein [Planobispora siamensis]|uniref:Uncharacterized protein n=1 Tax=Planobispora siamensis TaxID=936338 RepID=A0A8J3WKS1_9ACTN|nr:DUF6042 family protein [Planobispora siamensis]GIH92870.1 hypothetical protein Psi01_35000 [Planobispora siamensis]
MPECGIVLVGQIATRDADFPPSVDELINRLSFGSPSVQGRGWDTQAWEPLEPHTDESLARLREELGDDDDRDAATINAEEAANREQFRSRLDELATGLGVSPLVTVRDVFDYLVACRIIQTHEQDGVTLCSINPTPPLPGEVLNLTPEENAKEDHIRWTQLYEQPSFQIIELFDPEGARHEELTTSLEKLAKKISLDVETVRQAILWLIEQGHFTASLDISTAERYEVFTLRVDWEKFAKDRIDIRFA